MSESGFFYDNPTPEQQRAQRTLAYAQALQKQGMESAGSSPYGGLRNAGTSLIGALLAKKADKNLANLATDREGSYTRALGNFLGPKDNSTWDAGPGTDASGDPGQISVSPRVGASMAQRLGATMNPDLMRQMGPQIAQQQMQETAPITPYQQAELKDRADERNYEHTNADYAQIDAGSDAIQNAMDKSVTIPKYQMGIQQKSDTAAAEANARLPSELTVAQAKADAGKDEFGRSMQGHAYNILAAGLNNDAVRSSSEYATAWQILSNPHVDSSTGTIVTPDLSAFKPPIGGQAAPPGAGQPPQDAPGAAPPQRMPNIQSFAPPNPSQAEAGSAGYANRLSESSGIIDKNQNSGTSLYNRGVSALPGGNYAVGSEYQQLDQAERNFVNAQLRRESGAAISESEFQNARKQYFPQPGDKPEVLAQKKRARDMAVQNMQLSAGNVLLPPGVIQQSSPPKGAPVVPQQQGFGATAPGASPSRFKIEQVQ